MQRANTPNADRPQMTVVGVSAWSHEMRRAIKRLAAHSSAVLITGAIGTGKETIARAIHASSSRAAQRFVPVDCAAVEGAALRELMLGRADGVHSVAGCPSLGCLAAADHGTLYLDNVAALDLEMQREVVRLLETGTVVPAGSRQPVAVDVRVIAAATYSLGPEVTFGRFLGQLCDLLAPHALHAVPLNDRPADIEPLANAFLAELSSACQTPLKRFAPDALGKMVRYSWPGNVGELRCVVERAVVLTASRVIDADQIELAEVEPFAELPVVAGNIGCDAAAEVENWPTLHEVEREHFRRTLQFTHNDHQSAARLLGMASLQFQARLDRYGLYTESANARNARRAQPLRKAA